MYYSVSQWWLWWKQKVNCFMAQSTLNETLVACRLVFKYHSWRCIVVMTWGPFHQWFFHPISNSMGNWSYHNSTVKHHIAVVACAKFHSDHFFMILMRAEWNFHPFELWRKNRSWYGPFSQMSYELIIQILKKYELHTKSKSGYITISHMPWQLSFHDMCKFFTWMVHQNKN